jgi:hypothetical protein
MATLPMSGAAAPDPVACLQEIRVVNEIATYFNTDIPEVPYDDEDKFVEVLKKAGLTDG